MKDMNHSICIITPLNYPVSCKHFLLIYYLWGSPFHWHFSSMRNVVIFIHQITRHSKVTDLETASVNTMHKIPRLYNLMYYCTYFTSLVISHQYVPRSQVPMYKCFSCKVVHTRGNLLTKLEQKLLCV